MSIDSLTVCAYRLLMRYNETLLSSGTCFFWRTDGPTYLVTNWHNLSGINPETGAHLSATLSEPNNIIFEGLTDKGDAAPELQELGGILALDAAEGRAWLEHPAFGGRVDVACVALSEEMSQFVHAINDFQDTPIATSVSDDVFILGFPLGYGVGRFPVWKRASVASELSWDVDQRPRFLVDTATTKGMSGSPVIRRSYGNYVPEGGGLGIVNGAVSRFMGVYSGRLIAEGSLDAQLGFIWKPHVVVEIIEGGVQGRTTPLQ